ncbi:MAG TPA: hypothetical protein VLJ39_01910 [Tepidisphaeraceae bacterium]|nr:hypothetical protein [Tepidisphaeraceae bacterium]
MRFDWREFVSRGAMLFMGLGGVVVGIALVVFAWIMMPRQYPRYDRTWDYVMDAGVGLGFAGGFIVFSAFKPPFRG